MDLITSIVLVLCRLNFVMIAVARTIGQSSIQEVDELYLPPLPSFFISHTLYPYSPLTIEVDPLNTARSCLGRCKLPSGIWSEAA